MSREKTSHASTKGKRQLFVHHYNGVRFWLFGGDRKTRNLNIVAKVFYRRRLRFFVVVGWCTTLRLSYKAAGFLGVSTCNSYLNYALRPPHTHTHTTKNVSTTWTKSNEQKLNRQKTQWSLSMVLLSAARGVIGMPNLRWSSHISLEYVYKNKTHILARVVCRVL